MNQLFLFISILGIVTAIPKKFMQIDESNSNENLIDNKITQKQNDIILIDQITDWELAKQAFVNQLQEIYEYCQVILLNQELVGLILVLIISYSFYLMIKQEDIKLKQKSKSLQQQQQRKLISNPQTIQILSDSLEQKNQGLPQMSTIHGSICYAERVNKTIEELIVNEKGILQRSSSHPLLNKQDQSVEELNYLLRDIN
ncbi:unnamed protein product [Paramecium primaurelia]|uniref:Transmembrane protein n=2 Tax=Paramecium TaxID=5884 RepID=A0A8S1X0I5_9CILI|nr:unnamed protein product [Paramecium primaurelia]CAD8195653.1 unnamed protein product [Paramecium pentaurelia]